jgi:hypothetical protein
LLEISLGDLGLKLDEFYSMTPGELFLRIGAFNKAESRQWHKIRVMAAIYLNSIKKRGKTIKPQDIIQLPGDNKIRLEKKPNLTAQEFKELKERWQTGQSK